MNMKKVLAAVLAVMLAISAMAITAFADEYVIVLSSETAAVETADYSTVNFTIPVANAYGYVSSDDVLTLTLPVAGKYYVTVNGTKYTLGLKGEVAEDAEYGEYEITFGTLAHSWNALDNNTCLPQSTGVNAYTALAVTGEFHIERTGASESKVTYRVCAKDFMNFTNGGAAGHQPKFTGEVNNYGWGVQENLEYNVKANWNDESTSYCWDWNPTDGNDVSGNWSEYVQAGLENLKWDATLQNKAAILGAETAKVVVTYDKEFVGNYYFGLKATYANGESYDLGGNFNNWTSSKLNYASYIEITKPTNVVEFEIDTEVLYSTLYGVFNETMSVDVIEDTHTDALTTINNLKKTATTGTYGNYSWDANNIYFCGTKVEIYNNQIGNAKPTSVVIVLGTADDSENVDIETPVESTEEEVDTDDVDNETVDVEDKTEDTNPTTGIALAIVPMMVAAAAVVASKRR